MTTLATLGTIGASCCTHSIACRVLQVWVYEDAGEEEGNLYVHHDVLLPEFPLSLAWMDCPPSSSGRQSGNLAAVGSMGPGIEIWDLNVVDTVEPLASLGGPVSEATSGAAKDAPGEEEGSQTQKKKKKRKKLKVRLPAAVIHAESWGRAQPAQGYQLQESFILDTTRSNSLSPRASCRQGILVAQNVPERSAVNALLTSCESSSAKLHFTLPIKPPSVTAPALQLKWVSMCMHAAPSNAGGQPH